MSTEFQSISTKKQGVEIYLGFDITTWNDQTYSQLKICWIRGLVRSISLILWDEHSSQYYLLHASKVDYPMKKYQNMIPGSYPVASAAVKSESCNWDLRKHMGGWYTWEVDTPGRLIHLGGWYTWEVDTPGRLIHLGGWYTQDIPTSTNRTARQFEKWSEIVHLLYRHGMTSRFQPHLCQLPVES